MFFDGTQYGVDGNPGAPGPGGAAAQEQYGATASHASLVRHEHDADG